MTLQQKPLEFVTEPDGKVTEKRVWLRRRAAERRRIAKDRAFRDVIALKRQVRGLETEIELLKDVIGRVLQYFPAQLEYKPALLAKIKEIVGCRPPRIGRF